MDCILEDSATKGACGGVTSPISGMTGFLSTVLTHLECSLLNILSGRRQSSEGRKVRGANVPTSSTGSSRRGSIAESSGVATGCTTF